MTASIDRPKVRQMWGRGDPLPPDDWPDDWPVAVCPTCLMLLAAKECLLDSMTRHVGDVMKALTAAGLLREEHPLHAGLWPSVQALAEVWHETLDLEDEDEHG